MSFKASAFSNPKKYIDGIIGDDATALVCPVSYDPASLERVIGSIIAKWNGSDIGELCDHVFMISSMFKNKCWKSEKEYRFFVHQKRDKILKSACFKVRERDGQLVSYLDLPIQNWDSAENLPIYRICLGPGTPKGLDLQLDDFIFSLKPSLQGRVGIMKSNVSLNPVKRSSRARGGD